MIHTKEYLEEKYATPDPWGYKGSDMDRKTRIWVACKQHRPGRTRERYARALDIGCGEGWITQHLPAHEIHGIEISDAAAARFPNNVTRVHEPQGKYDLVVATGVLYDHYDLPQIRAWIEQAASGIVVTCNIKRHEQHLDLSRQINETTFPYHAGEQILRVYDYSALHKR